MELIHDEARSYLTRTDARFDVLQMSLIDTWAATGAGAFTLSENGLYTVEGWRVFLRVLKPGGIFSCSRWHNGQDPEMGRLVSLATASLLAEGVDDVSRRIVMARRGRIATLMISRDPFTEERLAAVRRVARRFGFRLEILPGTRPRSELFAKILSTRDPEALRELDLKGYFDLSPPTDERPYFFNMLKPRALVRPLPPELAGYVVNGNVRAARTLLVLLAVSTVLVAVVILGPLARAGLPHMDGRSFGHGLAYFSAIGAGFMLIQIPLMQRFSVYLGHPTYAVAVILFSMILATGVGSYLSGSDPARVFVSPSLRLSPRHRGDPPGRDRDPPADHRVHDRDDAFRPAA